VVKDTAHHAFHLDWPKQAKWFKLQVKISNDLNALCV